MLGMGEMKMWVINRAMQITIPSSDQHIVQVELVGGAETKNVS